MYKIILFFLIITTQLLGKYVPTNDVDTNKYSIQVSTCKSMYCYLQTIDKIDDNDSYYTAEKDNEFITYFVNIKDRNEAKALQEKYAQSFTNSILRKTYPLKIVKKIVPPKKPIKKKKVVKKEELKKEPKKTIVDKYKLALNHFKNREFQKAYDLFEELFNENLNDTNINFYLGRSAFELKNYQQALVAYERVLFEKPDSLRTQLEMGRAFFLNKNYKSAQVMFVKLKNNPKVPANIKKSIQKYLDAIDKHISRHALGGVAIFGLNYDSNINNRSSNDTFNNVYIPTFNTYLDMNNTTQDDSAWSHQEVILVNYSYKINEKTKTNHNLMVFNKNMFDSKYKTKDVQLVNYNPTLNVTYNEQTTLDYGLFIDNMWLNNENYIMTYGLLPKITHKYDDLNTISGHLKYQIKSHKQSDTKEKDSTYTEIASTLKHTYNDKTILNPSILISTEKKKNSNTQIVNNNSFTLGLTANYVYKPNIIFASGLHIKQTAYAKKDPSYLTKQKDTELKLSVGSNYIHSKKWIATGNISYIDHDSNIPPNVYSKYIFGLNIIRTF